MGHSLSVFEAIMLLCFGISWPVSIAKTLRTKRVEGKSPLFMVFILVGYLSGILHKVIFSFDWVILLYTFNLTVVAIDLWLYFRYRKPIATAG
jgi:hypothetical protein